MARLFLRKFGVEIPLSKAAPERTSHLSERACMPEHLAALGGIAEAAVPTEANLRRYTSLTE
jgi:hypothetical protein